MPNEVQATHGRKMIEVKVRFWTDDIAEQEGHIVPKHCWSAGVVRVSPNEDHGIADATPVPFNSLASLLTTIEDVFIAHGIKVHKGSTERRYSAEVE